MTYKTKTINGKTAVALEINGRFAINEIETVRKEMMDVYDKKIANAYIDFSKCTFIDSTGLGLMVSLHKRCAEQGGHLIIAKPSDVVKQLLSLTRLDQIFEIEE